MNTTNITKLINLLESIRPENFDMSQWMRYKTIDRPEPNPESIHNCGTAACIGGYAALLFRQGDAKAIDDPASEFLGISTDDAEELFFPDGLDCKEDFPAPRAIDVLKHLRDTGEVAWSNFPAANYHVSN